MKATWRPHPKVILWTLLTLFSTSILAQSKSEVAAKLEEADELFKNRKLKEAQELYLQYSNALSLDQQSNLGLLYIYSDPANKDYTTAMQWFQKAAGKGHTKSITYIASLYMDGLGVAKDTTVAFSWYKKAADLKDADAMLAVGAMYQLGKNTKADEKAAISWYKTAAEHGRPKGYYYIGDLYFQAKLYNTALDWYKQAAYDKDVDAMLKIAQLYEEGNGVIKDIDEAISWYNKITRTSGYTKAHSKAYDNLKKHGGTVPSSDINTMKPILTRLAAAVANNFNGYIGDEISSNDDDKKSFTIVSEMSYYKSLIPSGLKDAHVRKEVVKPIEAAGYRTKAGTYYRFSADVVFRVNQEKADEVFNEWSSLLKVVFPGFQAYTDSEAGRSLTLKGAVNGKDIEIALYNCCPARGSGDRMVSLTIDQPYK